MSDVALGTDVQGLVSHLDADRPQGRCVMSGKGRGDRGVHCWVSWKCRVGTMTDPEQ